MRIRILDVHVDMVVSHLATLVLAQSCGEGSFHVVACAVDAGWVPLFVEGLAVCEAFDCVDGGGGGDGCEDCGEELGVVHLRLWVYELGFDGDVDELAGTA